MPGNSGKATYEDDCLGCSQPAGDAKLNTTTPAFDWDDVAGSGNITYRIEVDNTANFTSPEFAVDALASSNATATALTEGIYNWRVRATDSSNYSGEWSTVQQFTIDVTPPSAPDLVSPYQNLLWNR